MRKDTYKLTNDVGRTSKGKNQQYEYQTATKCSQRPRGLIIQQPNQCKDSVQIKSQPAQVERLTKQRGITLCPQPLENALKVALIIQRRYKRRAGSKPASNIYFSNNLRERRNTLSSILSEQME